MTAAPAVDVSMLDPAGLRADLPALAEVLHDCVSGGASVSFMNPFAPADAMSWWRGIARDAERGAVAVFAARLDGRIVGTAQLWPADKPNQPHRGDVAKVLVRRDARQRGIGKALMTAVEEEARRRGLTLLTLDTATGSAGERLYASMGWERVGVIPDYALWPDGGFCDTTIYYRRL